FLLDKYGYWRTQTDVGYATDFDLVNRWLKGKEKWAMTLLPTVFYENSHQNMKAIYEAYNDQDLPVISTEQVKFISDELVKMHMSNNTPRTSLKIEEIQEEEIQQSSSETPSVLNEAIPDLVD